MVLVLISPNIFHPWYLKVLLFLFSYTVCLPIEYTSIYAKDKKGMRKFFKDADHLNIQNMETLIAF